MLKYGGLLLALSGVFAFDIGLKWHDYDASEDAWEDTHKGKWIKI